MASATVVVLDVGKGMDGGGHGGGPTYLEQALEAVALLVESKILHAPRDLVGVVLFGTRETNNAIMAHGYDHVVTLRDLTSPDVHLLKLLSNVSPGESEGDWVDALLVASDLLLRDDNPKLKKRVFLITGGHSYAETNEHLERLKDALLEKEVGFNAIGVDFFECDDEDNDAVDERPVTEVKKNNERALRRFTQRVKGTYHPIREGLRLLSELRTKATKQVPTFMGELDVGGVKIPCKMFIKAKAVAFPSAKKLSASSQQMHQQTLAEGVELDDVPTLDVKMERDYAGVIEVDKTFAKRDELLKGYRYGKKIVTMAKNDLDALKHSTERCMTVIGFVPRSQIPRHFFMGQPELLVPTPGNTAAAQAMASLVLALLPKARRAASRVKRERAEEEEASSHEHDEQGGMDDEERVVLVRLQKKAGGGPPCVAVLLPHVKRGDHYGFYCHVLPFAEDVRSYDFPALSASHLVRQHLAPSTAQLEAMSRLVACADLDTGGPDGEELLKPSETFNPATQHFYSALRYRASKVPVTVGDVIDPACVQLFPVDARGVPVLSVEEAQRLPGLEASVREVLEPAKSLWTRPPVVEAVRVMQTHGLFECRRIERAGAGKRKTWDALVTDQAFANAPQLTSYRVADPNALGGADNNDDHDDKKDDGKGAKRGKKDGSMTMHQLMHGDLLDQVGTHTPVQDFEHIMARRDCDMVERAIAQMIAVIQKLVHDSIHGHLYPKALECADALRRGCVREDEPELWNDFLRAARAEYKHGMHRQFWFQLVDARLTLIHEEESANTAVTLAEAQRFVVEEDVADDVAPAPMLEDGDEDDLLEGLE